MKKCILDKQGIFENLEDSFIAVSVKDIKTIVLKSSLMSNRPKLISFIAKKSKKTLIDIQRAKLIFLFDDRKCFLLKDIDEIFSKKVISVNNKKMKKFFHQLLVENFMEL